MPSGLSPGEPTGPDLPAEVQAELEAERAATDHWRRVARQRSAEYAELRHRPTVRGLLAVERRLAPLREPVARARDRLRGQVARVALGAAALGHDAHQSLSVLESAVRLLPAPAPDERRLALVVVGSAPSTEVAGTAGMPVDVVVVASSRDAVADVRRALDATDHELVGVLLGTSEPLDATWLSRLVAEVDAPVVAATPMTVHPARPPTRSTPHDGLVRAAGLSLDLGASGIPVVLGADAGSTPDPSGPSRSVDAASGACFVVDRAAYDAAGGLPPGDDLDVAAVELSARLRARGGEIVVVPGAVVLDGRPVRTRRDLCGPIDPDGPEWSAALDGSGPALLRSVRPLDGGRLRFAITVAAPSAKVASRWGDWHLAEGLAGGLRRLGHEVLIQTAAEAEGPAGRTADVHLVLRGLRPVARTAGQRHVLWIISHPESIEDDELDAADLVLVASSRFAEHLRRRTGTPVQVLLQATDHHRFFPHEVDPVHRHPVTVVAKTRDVLRPVVRDALAVGIRPAIYGGGWRELVDPGLVVADHVDNDQLATVYSSAGVVLNDHWRTMQAWGFVSNRLFDVLACGTPVISDPVPGISELFGQCVIEYHSPPELQAHVDEVLRDPAAARERAESGRALVLAGHTFDHRARELVQALRGKCVDSVE